MQFIFILMILSRSFNLKKLNLNKGLISVLYYGTLLYLPFVYIFTNFNRYILTYKSVKIFLVSNKFS